MMVYRDIFLQCCDIVIWKISYRGITSMYVCTCGIKLNSREFMFTVSSYSKCMLLTLCVSGHSVF